MTPQPVIVKPEDFDSSKISFGNPENVNTGGKVHMTKIPLYYDGKLLVLQTPVFKRCSIRCFDKKTENDKVAVVLYQTVSYVDEEYYARDVMGAVSDVVKDHVKANVRSLFQRKKDSVADLTFYSPVQESGDSIRTAVPTISRDSMTPAKEVRFFHETRGELSKDDAEALLEENKRIVSGRALVSVPYAYTINKQAYGLKNMLCSLDFRKKPEDAEVLAEGASANKSEGSGMLNLGNSFC